MVFSDAQVIAASSILVATVGVLWGLLLHGFRQDQRALKGCREMHGEALEKIADLTGKYKYLQGRMDGVEQLSESVLRKIDSVKDIHNDKYIRLQNSIPRV